MNDFEEIRRLKPDYTVFGLKSNPFTIIPLFFNYADRTLSERDEKLFISTAGAKQAATSFGLGKRLLVCGGIGVGKTTIMNMLLYLGKFRDNLLPIRVVIKADTVDRAIQELLYNYCFGMISELRTKSLTKPLEGAKKWLLEKKYVDKLYDFMARLMGPFEEEASKEKRKSSRAGVSVAIEAEVASEEALTSSLKTYVENLPIKAVQDHLTELQSLTSALGYKGVVFALDEADHIRPIEKVIAMLTSAREIFFTSQLYTFIVAGSEDLICEDERGEVSGIFDSTIDVGQLREDEIKQALLKRLRFEKQDLSLEKVFESGALNMILQQSRGVVKFALRLAQNSLDEAVAGGKSRVSLEHVMTASKRVGSLFLSNLKEYEIRILSTLSELGQASPGDRNFQRRTRLSRPRLTVLLNSLSQKGLVDKTKIGRKTIYSVKSYVTALIS